MQGGWRRLPALALWLAVIAYGVFATRQFFQFTDGAIYLSSDDGLANISYALASEGRYGFLSSPLLAGMGRDQGLFSYGPVYFYVGAALIWLFGYNMMLLRMIHLVVIFGLAAAGRAWFGRTAGGAAGAFTAIGLIMAFERVQWPMVRPDSMVSLFAVAMIICAGLAIRTGRSIYWFGAGFAGATAAFTHLVAWSLIPAVVVTLLIGYLVNARGDDGRWQRPLPLFTPLLATGLGGLGGAFLFYASFGFRIDEQYRFLTDYQRFTGSMGGGPSPDFTTLVLKHFEQAYWYLPYPLEYAVWTTLLVAVLAVPALLLFDRGERRRQMLAFIAPPTVVWVAYLLTLGTYNNFHGGYAILTQVAWLWTGGALVAAVLDGVKPWPSIRRAAIVTAWTGAFVLAVGMVTFFVPRTNYRALAAEAAVPIQQYYERVLSALPVRARAWGSVEFGIEHPARIQLVQFWDGLKIIETLERQAHAALAPDYLVWGRVENGANTNEVLATADKMRAGALSREIHVGPQRLLEAFPDLRYTLVSMVAGPPYGVTRIYAWTKGAPAMPQPLVSVYDPALRQWSSSIGTPVAITMSPAPPATVKASGPGGTSMRTAVQTIQGEMPAGLYLLRVPMSAALTPGEPVSVLASSSATVQDDITDSAFGVDVSPWFAGESSVFLVYRHVGGAFFVSQIGTGHGGLSSVEASPIVALTNYSGLRRVPPPEHALAAGGWEASFPSITVSRPADGTVAVAGDSTQYGYQAYGPRITVEPGQRLRLRIPIAVSAGRGCLGLLDGTGERWLIAPDRLLPEYEIVLNDSETVRPVLADCSLEAGKVVPVQATIGDGTYALWSDKEELYVDQLMRAFRAAAPR